MSNIKIKFPVLTLTSREWQERHRERHLKVHLEIFFHYLVHTGFNIHLYISNLFSKLSWDLDLTSQ